MPLDIVKASDVKYDIRKILIIGVEKSGKTRFIGTMPRPILVFAGETGAESLFAGQQGIDIVQCYDLKGEAPGAGIRRFDKNFKELLMMKEVPYKTVALDPLSFLSDAIGRELDRCNPGLKGSSSTFSYWGKLRDRHTDILDKILSMAEYVVVTSHVRLNEDETTGSKSYLADLQGSIRDSIGGWFDAVLFTKVVPQGTAAKYTLQAIPNAQKKCGVRVPMGMESKVGADLEPDYQKIMATLMSTPTHGAK